MGGVMSIVLQSSGGGQITVQEPTTASNFTQTLPAASGEFMVSGNMPAFSAYAVATTSLPSTTYTKITFDTEEFDTNNNFASSRFTPTVAGYYQINGGFATLAASGLMLPVIYKNGSAYKVGNQVLASAGGIHACANSIVYFNGSTDYVEFYGWQSSGLTTSTVGSTTIYNYFNGAMLRAA